MKQLPQKLLNDLQGISGFDEASLLAAHQQLPVTSVRLHPVKGKMLFAEKEQVPWCSEGKYLSERPVFTVDPLYHGGAYYVQEASSMFLDHMIRKLLPERKGLRVLDLCAAPGGKSTLIASLLDDASLLLSNEVIRTRASILEENMTRWGYMNTWVCSNDPKDLGRLIGYFDVIVIDAPCSGSGLFRKDERALEAWNEANVTLCSQRQQRILADVWPALKEDGIVIYATCSYSPQEDEQILDWMAEEFSVTTLTVDVNESWGITPVHSSKDMAGYRFFPGKVIGEGFFIAAVQKNSSEKSMGTTKFKTVHDKKAFEQSAFLLNSSGHLCIPGKETFNAINAQHEADWHLLSKYVYLRKTGLELGSAAGKDWLPAHEIALSTNKSGNIPTVIVNKEQALHFLKKEDFILPENTKGWHLIQYEHTGLGWIKALGNRFNNYLPKHWRIRMDITDADWA